MAETSLDAAVQPSDCITPVPCHGSEGQGRLRANAAACSVLEDLRLRLMLAEGSVGCEPMQL